MWMTVPKLDDLIVNMDFPDISHTYFYVPISIFLS